jgi:hypothetical protein
VEILQLKIKDHNLPERSAKNYSVADCLLSDFPCMKRLQEIIIEFKTL